MLDSKTKLGVQAFFKNETNLGEWAVRAKETEPCLTLEAMSTHDACELARAAIRNGLGSDGSLVELASCGSAGRYTNNGMRDYRRLVERKYSSGSYFQ